MIKRMEMWQYTRGFKGSCFVCGFQFMSDRDIVYVVNRHIKTCSMECAKQVKGSEE